MVMKWALALPSFVFLLTGCGGPQAAHPSTSGHSPVPTAAAVTTPNPTATPVPVSAAPILTPGAIPLTVFSLKPGGQAGGTLTCPEWVVLNSTRLSYTDSELNEMANAFRIVANAGLFPKTIPDTLRIIQGRPTPLPKALATASPDCAIFLQITNTGRGTVQIPEVGFLLTRDPEPNRDQYRLVEACSLQGSRQYCGPERGGGPTGCSVYVADVQLQTGGAGTAFTTSPKPARPDLQCPEITLGPGQSTEIYLTSSSSQPFVYQIEPILVVVTSSGKTTVAIPEFANTAAFAAPSQFICYQLSGHAFTASWSGTDALDWESRAHQNAWCI